MAKYMTSQRRALISFFEEHHDESFTPKELAEKLTDSGISLSAIYRNITELEAEDKVVKTTRGGETGYRFTDCGTCREKIHLSCTECGRTYHLDERSARDLIGSTVMNNGFQINVRDTVIYGKCLECCSAAQGVGFERE